MPVEARIALAGDTMLGRLVGEHMRSAPFSAVVADELREITSSADLFVVNLECCISDRGTPWPDIGKPFFFRAPPRAVELLSWLGVDCVTLANNHALDFSYDALTDTVNLLDEAGIAAVGAGPDLDAARAWRTMETAGGLSVGVLGVSDHPPDFAAQPDRPGIAFADLAAGVPEWLTRQVRQMAGSVQVPLVTPHWGPNMTIAPAEYVRRAADALVAAGAGLVAGHSAHVFHGVSGRVLFDLGDFVDDYAVDPDLRNDISALFLVRVDGGCVTSVDILPVRIEDGRVCRAIGADDDHLRAVMAARCGELDARVVPGSRGLLRVPVARRTSIGAR